MRTSKSNGISPPTHLHQQQESNKQYSHSHTHTPPQNSAVSRAALIVINKSLSSESIIELRVRTYNDI